MPHMRVLAGAVVVVTSILALTGCGSQATEPTATSSVTVAPTTTPAPTPSPTASATPLPTATATATATTAADPDRPRNQCPDAGLGVSVVAAPGGGGAGNEEYQVLLTNTSGSSCALRGTPGVSVTGAGGAQLGKPAVRHQGGVRTVVLRDGDSVAAPLRIVNIGTDGGPLVGCTVRKGTGYRVYPPHSTKGFLVEDPAAVACAPGPSFMTVGPVAPLAG